MASQELRAFDVVVVGAGSAGCVVAGRLAERGLAVCLVEAGPDYGPAGSGRWPADILDASVDAIESHDWGFPGGPSSSRARIVGGCSAHNGCGIVWPSPDDIDPWPALGATGWTFATLEPWLRAAEERLRTRPSDAAALEPWRHCFLRAARELGLPDGLPLNAPGTRVGVGLLPVNAVGATRWNAAFAYLDPVRATGRLTLLDRALADRVLLDGGRATGVVVRRDDAETTVRADLVVAACGAYGTPALLGRSGIGDPDLLAGLGIPVAAALPGVGATLQDHPTVDVPFDPSPDLVERTRTHAAAAGPAAQALVKARSSHASGEAWDLVLGPWTAPAPGGRVDYAGILVTVSLPRSRGRVLLRSTDPTVLPAIQHGFLTDPDAHDLAVAREGVELALALAAAPAARRALASPRPRPPAGPDDGWLHATVFGNYHPCGTCPIGNQDDPLAVCDEDGRVRGIDALHVCDASLLPLIPRANIHLTVVAVAELLADRLAR